MFIIFTVAMAYYQYMQGYAHAKWNEAFFFWMIGISHEQGIRIIEDRGRFNKRNAMLAWLMIALFSSQMNSMPAPYPCIIFIL